MDKTGTYDGMKYIGDGTAVVGVPARDLTAEETRNYGGVLFLLSTGLYMENVKKAYTPKPTKSAVKGTSNADKENTK